MRLGFQIQTYVGGRSCKSSNFIKLLSSTLYIIISLIFFQNWYALSKALAEQEAWKFAKESGIDLVKIHPGFTFGPFLQPNLNLSVKLILNLINSNI